MSTPAVLPGLYFYPEVERKLLIEFANAESLVSLSRVSKYAQNLLSNDFFKSFLIHNHPSLVRLINEENESAKMFEQLPTFLPNHCWKITCTFINHPSGHPRFSAISFAFFMETAAPSIQKVLEANKADCESKIKEICGYGYQDPESPIHKAWLDIEKTIFPNYIKEQKHNFLDRFEKKLIPEDFFLLQKSVLHAPHSDLNFEELWDFKNLPEHLKGLKTKPHKILLSVDIKLIYLLHKKESELPLQDGYQKYLNYRNLEITRAEKQLELESHNARLSHLSLPSPLTQDDLMVLNAYRLSEKFVSLRENYAWIASMTKTLPNPDLMKNFIKEFEITRTTISVILGDTRKQVNNQELY